MASDTRAAVPLIKTVNLHKWYKGVHALKGVNLELGYNQVIGLVGDNGAGKSTLIKILSGAHQQDEGEIHFEGKLVRLSSPRTAMALGIETIYQYTAMVPQMSIARNIFIGREPVRLRIGRLGLLDHAKMAEESIRAIRGVELHLRSPDTPVDELSGGERQGVAIARAMYFKTKVLSFVEGLKSQGITSIFITHNLHHVYPISDRIVVMARGEKIADLDKAETSIEHLTELLV